MKWLKKRKLSFLLSDEIDNYTCTGRIAASELLATYRRRFTTSAEVYSGFPQLLDRLEVVDDQALVVHAFGGSGNRKIIFTDAGIENIIGRLEEQKGARVTD